MTANEAVQNALAWFQANGGWVPPDESTLAEWLADRLCRCPDGCTVAADGWCEHGIASWKLILVNLRLPAGVVTFLLTDIESSTLPSPFGSQR